MNILLISVQSDLEVIGLKFLHYSLLNQGFNSYLLHLPNIKQIDHHGLENLKKFIMEISPGFIGISLMSVEFHSASTLTKFIKDQFKSIPIIWGGIHPTITPETCLEYADYVCLGEGEQTIIDVAKAISNNEDIKNINNLCYLEGREVKRNPLYPLIEKLDEVPSYDLIPVNGFIQKKTGEIVPLDKRLFTKYARYRGKTYGVVSSRGCPFSCSYCCNNFLSRLYDSKKLRRRSIPNVIAELQRAIKNNPEIDYINFQDDCFVACSDDHLREFCQEYREKVGRPFIIRSIPIYITRDKMKSLKEAGVAWISIGLQSGSDRVCKEVYQRKSFKSDFLKAANIVNEFNVGVYYDLILDNPFETEEDKIETVITLMETPRPFHAQFFSLTMYIGTELYERTKKECPDKIEDCVKKDYEVYHKDVLNDLIRLAVFLNKNHMQKILDLYLENPNSGKFKFFLFIARLYSFFIREPVTYFKMIKLSQRGSWLRTIKVLPNYYQQGIVRYLNQFRAIKA